MKDSVIAYCGVPGSFGHIMAVRHFGNDNIFVGTLREEDIFIKMEKGEAQFGVTSLENNWIGSIREHFDQLIAHRVFIIGDEYLSSVHNLIAIRVKGKTLEERVQMIRKVLSHPTSLRQCRPFLDAHPYMEPTVFSDTGRSSQYVADMADPAIAAIASLEAARIYGLDIIVPNIQASSSNITRYAYLGCEEISDAECNKGSIVTVLKHRPGELFRLLEILANYNCNITWIEQRMPKDDLDGCVVVVDFEFSKGTVSNLGKMFENMREITKSFRVLGVYKSICADLVH